MKEERAVLSSGWVWRFRPEAGPWLKPALTEISQLNKGGRGELIKETGRRRAIWKYQPQAGPVLFVKYYGRPPLLQQIKYWFRNSRSRQEWKVARALADQGFPVATHFALGERMQAGRLQEDYLVQECLTGFRNFDRFFEDEFRGKTTPGAGRERNALIRELARLIRRLHDQGVWQRDFKPDSVMVARSGQGFQLKLVDLERVRLVSRPGGLSQKLRLDNLAKLDHTFGFVGNTADRLRFWRAYQEDSGGISLSREEGFSRVSALAEVKFRERARERQVWARTVNQVYAQFEHGPWRVSYHRELAEDWLRGRLDHLDDLIGTRIQTRSQTQGTEITLAVRKTRGLFRPGFPWGFGGARYGLKLVAHLYYRRVPFVPARAAMVRKGWGDWREGCLLVVAPGPPFQTWSQAGPEIAFEVGSFFRILNRMGITLGRIEADSVLVDLERPAGKRLYLNRVEDVILDQTFSPEEARRRLLRIAEVLAWPNSVTMKMQESFRDEGRRWFIEKERW